MMSAVSTITFTCVVPAEDIAVMRDGDNGEFQYELRHIGRRLERELKELGATKVSVDAEVEENVP